MNPIRVIPSITVEEAFRSYNRGINLPLERRRAVPDKEEVDFELFVYEVHLTASNGMVAWVQDIQRTRDGFPVMLA